MTVNIGKVVGGLAFGSSRVIMWGCGYAGQNVGMHSSGGERRHWTPEGNGCLATSVYQTNTFTLYVDL